MVKNTKPRRTRLWRPTDWNAPDEDQDETEITSRVHDSTEQSCLQSQAAGILVTAAGIRAMIVREGLGRMTRPAGNVGEASDIGKAVGRRAEITRQKHDLNAHFSSNSRPVRY
jgi:hypothetical protein